MRANSLKAWKDEQEKLKAEEEAKEKEKEAKRAKSADKKKVCMHGCIACTSFDSCVRCCYVSYTCSWGLCH